MSFARNFALGQQIAKTAMDTYNTARQNKEFEDIQSAKPEEFSGYTAQDGEQLAAIANARDPQGNPYYTLDAQPGGQYGIRSNFQVQGADGQMATPADVGIQQRRVSNFLGQRYDAEQLTPERMEGLRARAMAGAVSKTDPIRGMGLMQSIKAGERDDTRFDWEKQSQPLKQRAAELQIAGGERTERQGVRADSVQSFEDDAMKMPEADVRGALTSYLNTNQSDLPLLVTGSTKGGFMMAERNPQTGEIGKSFQVPLAVGRKLVVGQQLAAKGMGAEALKYLTGVDDNISAIVDKYNKQTLDISKVNNDATYRQGALDRFREELGIKNRQLGIQGQELAIRGRIADAQIGSYNRANQPPIVALTAEAERLVQAGTFKDVPTAIEALKKGAAKRDVDPKAYAETMAKFNEVYGDAAKARMATDQLFGLTAPTNAVAEQLKALNDKKGGTKPGAAAPTPPAAPLGLQQRLGNAIGTDNSAGNRNQFIALADEASQAAPAITQQIEALRRAVPMASSAGERGNLESRIGELESDLGLYRSILDQRNAQRGY
jgi:hypothetical protein